ncbi:Cell surface protein [Methanosarcina barkeri str. Wiesmoor]|uniref:Cell surface protein n=2 Tax=Methanosarcina barkeri TaxID=2208 RepID=A0A0E3QNZ1_METBA|nr:PQQ-binding-like beta-propeller repeat protein [Methanosarcina barkeri]AKB52188.1 Cell surface protein [Methanosarcina barkeri str. Wiesmoor]
MSKLKILMVCLTLLLVAAVLPALGSDWPQFQKDQVHSGITGDSAPITAPNLTISWVNDTVIPADRMAGIDASPIVYNGSVYAVTSEGKLFKYSLDGTAAGGNWPVSFVTNPNDWDFQLATPAACNGYIYVLDSGSPYRTVPHDDLYAINADTGVIVDRVNITDYNYTQFNTPITCSCDGKHILFGSMNITTNYTTWVTSYLDGDYYCYNITDVSNIIPSWSPHHSSNGYYWAGAAVIGDYAVFGNESGGLVSINYTGSVVDEVDASDVYGFDVGSIRSSVTYSNETVISDDETGRIYFTSYNSSVNGSCYALGFNATTGHFITADNCSRFIGYSTSTPAYYNGRIYVGSSNGLYCLNATTLLPIWPTPTSVGVVQSSPAISTFYGLGNEYIYVTTNSLLGGIYCVNSSGDVVWNGTSTYYDNDEYASLSLAGAAISGGRVFYGNDEGVLHGRANYTLYDFSVGASVDKWAYKYQVNPNPPNTNVEPNIEFTTGEYANIAADDGIYASHETTTENYSAAHRFVFKIDDNEKPWITAINVAWNGKAWHDTGDPGATLYIWNGTGYEELDDDANSQDEFWLIGEKTSNISNYIDSSNNVTILVVQNDKDDGEDERSHIWTDYVKLVATP